MVDDAIKNIQDMRGLRPAPPESKLQSSFYQASRIREGNRPSIKGYSVDRAADKSKENNTILGMR